MKRREMLLATGAAALGLSAFPMGWAAAQGKKKQTILYFTRSAGFKHSVVDRKDKPLAYSEKVLIELGKKHGFDVVCSQDPKDLEGDLSKYDAIAFYTTGNPLTPAGKENLLAAVKAGKGFIGFHCATDTYHSKGVDPYIAMIGGEFIVHCSQQPALMKVVDPKFPGVQGLGDGFKKTEEWYTMNKFAKDLHVILLQETAGMHDWAYQRPSFPATWAHLYGKGRVFYTSMGHREDIWVCPEFEQVVLGGIAWALGNVEADVTPNLAQVAPGCETLAKQPPKKPGQKK
jgi:uncharacterized protein